MSSPLVEDPAALAFAAALQVAAINALRGLLVAEAELDPHVDAICVVMAAGRFEVTTLDAAGAPVGGYAL